VVITSLLFKIVQASSGKYAHIAKQANYPFG